MQAAELFDACRAARQWWSAARDGEDLHDPAARAHLDRCAACERWIRTLDAVTPRLRMQPVDTPDVLGPALAAWPGADARRGVRQSSVGRVLLSVAGAAGLLLALVGLLHLPDQSAGAPAHVGWELHSFETALGLGFLLAAARPARYVRPLLPLTAAVVAMTALPAAAFVGTAAGGSALVELSHVTTLLGLVGLLLMEDSRRQQRDPQAPRLRSRLSSS